MEINKNGIKYELLQVEVKMEEFKRELSKLLKRHRVALICRSGKNDNDNSVEIGLEKDSLNQRVRFLEEMVSKSTFAPFVETAKGYSVSLSDVEELRAGFGASLIALRGHKDKPARMSMMAYYGMADRICMNLGGEGLLYQEENIEFEIDNLEMQKEEQSL